MPRKKREEGTRAPNGSSSIYYSKSDGYWHGRVTVGVRDDGSPDRRHIKRKDESAVRRTVRDLENDRDLGTVRKSGRAWTVEKWLTHWVENIAAPSVRPNTMVGYRASVYKHLNPGVGKHRIDKLAPEHLERLYVRMTDSGLKASTAHLAHRTVRAALNEAVKRSHIAKNPAQIAKPPRVTEEEIVPFSVTEARQVLVAANRVRNGTRFSLALSLGLRQGEALGLQWRDIDFSAGALTVSRSIQARTWKHGCSDEKPCGRRYGGHCPERHGGGTVATEVKSRSGKRTVGIPPPLLDLLKQHRKDQREERINAGTLWHEEGWVFTNHVGQAVHPGVDHAAWKALLKKAGVRSARLHDARHTAATLLLVLGVPARSVMGLMGWSQVGMTARYQHMSTELASTIADQVGELLWSSDGGATALTDDADT